MYASPAWWGFTAASDRQQIDAFVRRGVRFGFYNAGDPTPSQLAKDADIGWMANYRHRHGLLLIATDFSVGFTSSKLLVFS